MTRTIGTLLLALGFLAVAAAVLVRDPASLDADIGAGILSLTGIPIGAVGLALIIIDRLRRVDHGPAGDRRSAETAVEEQ